MLDQDTAHALLAVTAEAGATVALVGDRAQLPAVGRGGVLDMAAQIRGRTYDMTELHRFSDAEYAALTLTMRDRETPAKCSTGSPRWGSITLHTDEEQARDRITEHTQDGEAITVATNDEAAALNERIRAGRVERGEVDDTMTATGSDGLTIGPGDLIQTRKNDSDLGVANRQQWIVQHVTDDGTVYAREAASGRKNPRAVALPAEYVSEHAHLSYAATAYGVQGATVNTSHTMLIGGDERSRRLRRHDPRPRDEPAPRRRRGHGRRAGRSSSKRWNATPQTVASTTPPHKPSKPCAASSQMARSSASPKNSPASTVKLNAPNSRRNGGSRSPTGSTPNAPAHRAEDDETPPHSVKAEEAAEQIRAEVAEPLIVQAEHDGAAYLASRRRRDGGKYTTRDRSGALGGARPAPSTAPRANRRRPSERRFAMRGRSTPRTPGVLPEWAAQVAERRAESDPRVSEAVQAVEAARS